MEFPQKQKSKWEIANWHMCGTVYDLEEAAGIMEVLERGASTSGEKGEEFEKQFAQYVGSKYVFAVSSCAAGLHLAAISIGIKPDDEIIVPAITFYATANPFAFQGAKVKFVEVDPRTFNMDPQKIEGKITSRTKAIIPVHLCGQPCDMDPILEIAKKHRLVVIEDCAHAPGAEYKGKKSGSIGDIGVFSFHQSKNMSTLGEGGMVTTNNDEYASKIALYRQHGSDELYSCIYPGLNYRMTDMQACVGTIQLKKLDRYNQIRISLARYLSEKLENIEGIEVPYEMDNVKHVYHLYNVKIDEKTLGIGRDTLLKKLCEEGIEALTHYSPPVYLLKCYEERGHKKGECPTSEKVAESIVTLPLNPRFNREDIDFLVSKIRKIVKD